MADRGQIHSYDLSKISERNEIGYIV